MCEEIKMYSKMSERKSKICAKTHMGVFYAILVTLILTGVTKLLVS